MTGEKRDTVDQLIVIPKSGVDDERIQTLLEQMGARIVQTSRSQVSLYHLVTAADDDAVKRCFEALSSHPDITVVQYNRQHRHS